VTEDNSKDLKVAVGVERSLVRVLTLSMTFDVLEVEHCGTRAAILPSRCNVHESRMHLVTKRQH